jgi:hypothetical protein
MGDAACAGHRDDLARGVDGGGGDQVRVVVAHLGHVDGGAHRIDLGETETAEGVEEARVHVEAGRVDDLGAGGLRDLRTDLGDGAVAHQHGRDGGARRGVDRAAANHQDLGGHRRGAGAETEHGDSEETVAKSAPGANGAEEAAGEGRLGHRDTSARGSVETGEVSGVVEGVLVGSAAGAGSSSAFSSPDSFCFSASMRARRSRSSSRSK